MKAEIVVVGGGSTGTSIAFNLAKAGGKDVVLLEKNFLGSGATGRSASIVRCHYPHEETAKMARQSFEFFDRQESAEFTKTGLLVLVAAKDETNLRSNIEMQRRLGVDATILSVPEVEKLEPRLVLNGITLVGWEPGAGLVDASTYVTSIARTAENLGVRIFQKMRLAGFDFSNGKLRAIITDSGVIETRVIVCATGPWSPVIAELLHRKFPITLRRIPLALIKHPHEFGGIHPIIFDVPSSLSYAPYGNKTIVGESRHTQDSALDPDKFDESIRPEEAYSFFGRVLSRIPALGEASFAGGWAGVCDDTPDGFPILGELPGVEGFYCAFGLGDHGFKLAPAVGKAMAELILVGHCKDFDIEEFRLSRFEEENPIRTPCRYSWGEL